MKYFAFTNQTWKFTQIRISKALRIEIALFRARYYFYCTKSTSPPRLDKHLQRLLLPKLQEITKKNSEKKATCFWTVTQNISKRDETLSHFHKGRWKVSSCLPFDEFDIKKQVHCEARLQNQNCNSSYIWFLYYYFYCPSNRSHWTKLFPYWYKYLAFFFAFQ